MSYSFCEENGPGDLVVLREMCVSVWICHFFCIFSRNTKHKLLQSSWQSHLNSGTWKIPPVTLVLLQFSHCLTGGRCLLSRRNRDSCTDLLINYNPAPVCLKKAASTGCVNGVSFSCIPLAFLPSVSLPNSGGTLLAGISLSSLHAERQRCRWARGWCEHHTACLERKARGEWDGKCRLYP